jgi:uncharacterized RDD family membrane protein YckC
VTPGTALQAPALGRRLASALYDLLMLAALLLVATFPFLAFFGDSTTGWRRHVLQGWVIVVAGAYFAWFWTHGGQTLPMKTWRLRLVRGDGAPVTLARALHRYVLAVLGLLAVGLGFLWALWDRDRQFLHDRLAGTALVDAAASVTPTAAPGPTAVPPA